MSAGHQTAISTLRRLLGEEVPRHTWTCQCNRCCSHVSAKRQLERAIPALLDLVEAADGMRRGGMGTDSEQADVYDEKREALERAVSNE